MQVEIVGTRLGKSLCLISTPFSTLSGFIHNLGMDDRGIQQYDLFPVFYYPDLLWLLDLVFHIC